MVTWMKQVSNFQIAKVQAQGIAQLCYEKSVAYKKQCVVKRDD